MNEVPRAATAVVLQSNFSRWEKLPDLSPSYFFLSLLFNVAWELWKLFRSSIQLALRNKNIRIIRV